MTTTLAAAPAAAPTMTTDRLWRAGAAVAVVVLLLSTIRTSVSAWAPRTPWDEVGVLEMARLIAGDTTTPPMLGSGYYPGWSFLMAPIWWFTDDPAAVYRAAIWLTIAVAMTTLWPLTLLARRWGLSTAQAVTAAALALLLPARTVQADYVLSENAFTLALSWAVLAAFVMWRRPTVLAAALFSLGASATFLVHARGIALMAAAAVWVLCFARRSVRAAVVAAVVLAGGFLGVRAIAGAINDRILLSGFGKEDLMLDAVTSTSPGLVARVLLNQVWAQVVGTWALAAVGAVLLAVAVRPELRAREVGPFCYLAGVTAAFVVMSVLWWSGPRFLFAENPRFDVWVYTRYIDPVALLVVLLALVGLIRGLRGRTLVAAAVASAAVMAPVLLWVAPLAPTWGAYRGPGNAAAILHWRALWPTGEPFDAPLLPSLTNANRFWLIASLAVLATIAALLLARRRPRVLAVGLLALFAASSWVANPSQFRDPPLGIEAGLEQVERVEGGRLAVVELDLACEPVSGNARIMTLNWTGYWLSPRELRLVDPETDGLTGDVVISCEDWPMASELGARAIKNAISHHYRVWVLPGPLQDELAAQDLLGEVPPG